MSISIQNTGRGFKVAYPYSDAATELGKTAFPGNFKWNAKVQTRDIEGQSSAIVGALKKWTAEATPHVEKAVQANVLSQKIIGGLNMADYPGIESVTATSNRIMIRLPNIPTATSTFMNAPFTGSFSYQPITMQDGVEKGNYYYADPTKPGIADTLKAALTVASGHIAQAGERDIGISKIDVHPAMKLDVAVVEKTSRSLSACALPRSFGR